MTQPTIRLSLLTEFLRTCGFQRLVWCNGKMSCFTTNNLRWMDADIHKSAKETGDNSLALAWALAESALEGHDQPFTIILGAYPPGEEL